MKLDPEWNVLSSKSRGEAVSEARVRLNLDTSEKYDGVTTAKVREFQQSMGLVPTGQLDGLTYSLLFYVFKETVG